MESKRRKLSTRSKSHGNGLLSRKQSKPAESPDARQPQPATNSTDPRGAGGKGKEKEVATQGPVLEQQPQKTNPSAKSIIPDPLNELPAWYSNDGDWAVTSAAQFRAKYPIHSPIGPRFYRNHHLLPPPRERRPPTVFSPIFPPMAATIGRTQDSARMSGLSRTPSGSPLPTPNSSQVRLHDMKGRTRKTSQTSHDNLILDATDPWGTHYHDQSPYDIGQPKERSSPELAESPAPTAGRPRRASLTAPTRHKTNVPSPLSQSTSALHLASGPLASHVPRRLSKSRRPFRGLFGSQSEPAPRSSHSMLSTPDEFKSLGRTISRTGSLVPRSIASSSVSLAPTEKKERGSIFGRLVRRFSVIRRSNTTQSVRERDSVRSARQSLSQDAHALAENTPPHLQRPPLRRPQSSDMHSRVLPPSMDVEGHSPQESSPKETIDAQSVVSLDSPSPSKLQVANPDQAQDTQVEAEPPAPTHTAGDVRYDMGMHSMEREQRVLEPSLHRSPSPTDSPGYHIPYTALSVISEGETYISTPPIKPSSSLETSPISPPTIPSLLSLSPGALIETPEKPVPLAFPPLPDLPPPAPVSEVSTVPPTPVSKTAPSLPPPTPISKGDLSLPPTPRTEYAYSAGPTPVAKPVSLPPVSVPQINAQQASFEKRPTSPPLPPLPEDDSSTVISAAPNSRRPLHAEHDLLSRASMIVNPPTPFAPPLVIPQSSESISGMRSQANGSFYPSNESPTKDEKRRMRSRRTETFKLIRSNSGEVPTLGHSAVVGRENWEVVESPKDGSPTKRSRSRKPHGEGNKAESSDDSDPQRKESRRHRSLPTEERPMSDSDAQTPTADRARNMEHPHHSRSPERRRSAKSSHSPEGVRATRTPVNYQPKSTGPSPTATQSDGVQRRTSTSASTRPASTAQATADLNTLKAKEAWEMERLWRGRSVFYGSEGVTPSTFRPNISSESRPSTIMSPDLQRASTIPSVGDLASSVSPTQGTNHTYFVVQAPYSGAQHAQYTQPPPPVIYATVASASARDQAASAHHQQAMHSRSFSDNVPFSALTKVPDLPPPRSNPLPEPPRMSSYRPAPLPPSVAN